VKQAEAWFTILDAALETHFVKEIAGADML
jgi:hypothetical protein